MDLKNDSSLDADFPTTPLAVALALRWTLIQQSRLL